MVSGGADTVVVETHLVKVLVIVTPLLLSASRGAAATIEMELNEASIRWVNLTIVLVGSVRVLSRIL